SYRMLQQIEKLLILVMLLSACREQAPAPSRVQLQSAHAGTINQLILVYTWSAEMSLLSLRDILTALPDAQILLLNQFTAGTDPFRTFATKLVRDGLGRNQQGQPRIQFVQETSAYGPWPRDQALVDEQGRMWVSASNSHQLQNIMLALDESYGVQRHAAEFVFAGASLLRLGKWILCPDRLDTAYLAQHLRGPFLSLPSPAPPAPFHLDLVVMPLSERVVVVGDDQLAKTALLALNDKQIAELTARWLAEYAVAANNFDFEMQAGAPVLREVNRPALILKPLLNEKFKLVAQLAQPEVFRAAVQAEPDYVWDDQIATQLTRSGFEVVRVPFWPASNGIVGGRKTSGLPMLCYPNCLVWDDGILMPVYGIPALDEMARARLESACRKKVYPVSGSALLGYSYSGPHCLTLEFRE
ncbi:MAG: hypothetical protein AAB354_02710, partial [candidate division KSB1 bacterium]